MTQLAEVLPKPARSSHHSLLHFLTRKCCPVMIKRTLLQHQTSCSWCCLRACSSFLFLSQPNPGLAPLISPQRTQIGPFIRWLSEKQFRWELLKTVMRNIAIQQPLQSFENTSERQIVKVQQQEAWCDWRDASCVSVQPASHPAHRPSPSIRWHINISHWSCYRWLHSDTSTAADSLLRKTLQGILGKKQKKEHLFFTPSVTCWTEMTASLCLASTYLLCSWVRSSPACRHTVRWPGGRCRCYGSYSFGYILSHRTQMGTLPGEGQIM